MRIYADLDLKSSETFIWEASDDDDDDESRGHEKRTIGSRVSANLTVYMPGTEENVLSMERFKPMINESRCGDDYIDIQFHSLIELDHAKAVWDWVNGADNHSTKRPENEQKLRLSDRRTHCP